MKHLIFTLCLVASFAQAQVSQRYAARIYRVGDQLVIADSIGNNQTIYPFTVAQIVATNSLIRVNISGLSKYYTPPKILNKTGTPYSTTSTTAVVAGILATVPDGTIPTDVAQIGGVKQTDYDAKVSELTAQKVTTVSNLTALATFERAGVINISVADTTRGGNFTYYSTGFTADGGVVLPANGGGYWVRKVENKRYRLNWYDNIDLTGISSASSRLSSIIATLPIGSTLVLPVNSTVRFVGGGSLIITNNISIEGEKGAKIKASGTPANVITFRNLSNISFKNVEVFKESTDTTTSACVYFDNCSNITINNIYAHSASYGILLRKCSYASISGNRVTYTQKSGIRFNKNGNLNTDACSHVFVFNNYCAYNCLDLATGDGAYFLGADGGTGAHSDFHIYDNTADYQGQVCLGADDRVYDLIVHHNTFRQTGTKGEIIAIGGGSGTDGMKRAWITDNYLEQPIGKANGSCILLYSNVTDCYIYNNRTKGGPQGLFIHYAKTDSYFENIQVRGNTFESANQGVLLFKNTGLTMATPSTNIRINYNTFFNVTTLTENSTVAFGELGYTMNFNFWNGVYYVTAGNLTLSAATLPEKNPMGYWNQTGTAAKTVEGSIYIVNPANTTAGTNILIGATGLASSPTQRFGGIQVTLTGTGYANTRTSLVAGNGATRKTIGTGKLDTGDVSVFELQGDWNEGLLKIGTIYMWAESGKIRAKIGLPTTATDGTIIFQ